MTQLHLTVNFIIVLLLVVIVILFLRLAQVHAFAYFRERKLRKRKHILYSIIEQYCTGKDTVAAPGNFRTRAGIAVLSEVLAAGGDSFAEAARRMVREAGFEAYIKRQLESADSAYRILLIKSIGELRLQGFNHQITEFLYQYKKDVDLQYAGFLTLALLGEGAQLIAICTDDAFAHSLSFRSLKEIFKHFNGDRTVLCEALLRAPDNYIRRVAINMVGEYKLDALAAETMKLLRQLDINVVIDAMRALSALRYAPCVGELRALLLHERWEVRSAVVRAFAAIDLEAYAEDIARGLSDQEWWVRYNAAAALAGYSLVRELQQSPAVLEDRFATEILRYAIARKALRREVQPT